MNRISWLLERLGRRLVAWSAATARGARSETPPLVAPGEPFDAKQRWLDRVAHLPPQAWQQGGRPVPAVQVPARNAVVQREAPSTLPTELRSLETPSASKPPPVVRRGAAPAGALSLLATGRDRGRAASAERAAPVARARPAAPHLPTVVDHVLRLSVPAPPLHAETVRGERSVPLRLVPERIERAADPARLERRPGREVGSPTGPVDAVPTGLAPAGAGRVERGADPRRAYPAPIAFESVDSASPDPDEPRLASPVAEFDSRRTHAPDLPQPPMAPAVRQSPDVPVPGPTASLANRHNGRREPGVSVERNPPAGRWPDLPLWPAPYDPWARAADPHAHDRRQRLAKEQRG